jgi:hypothetical protein
VKKRQSNRHCEILLIDTVGLAQLLLSQGWDLAGRPAHAEPVQSLAKGRIAALKQTEKYSRTGCTLLFFSPFGLALHPLIEPLNRL